MSSFRRRETFRGHQGGTQGPAKFKLSSLTFAVVRQVSSLSANNLIGTGGSGGLVNLVNHNQVGVAEPLLGPLASSGGSTQTLAVLPGSPAIWAGSATIPGVTTET